MNNVMDKFVVLGKKNPRLLNAYKEWLFGLVGAASDMDSSYYFLCEELWKFPFTWTIKNDKNRAQDGRDLRHVFAGNEEYSDYDIDDSSMTHCTVLEMLIGISYRMEDMTEKSMLFWFWEILYNLGLNEFADYAFYDLGGRARVQYIIDTVVRRQYKRNGNGGLFPLNSAKKDQRRIELFYQMCGFLDENYDF